LTKKPTNTIKTNREVEIFNKSFVGSIIANAKYTSNEENAPKPIRLKRITCFLVF